MITTRTGKEVEHGPTGCYCYNPCTNSVEIVPATTLQVNQYVLVEDRRDPNRSKYIYGQTQE